ncbi:MAG: hypothetical protein J6Y48_19655, partial [Clostridia bacterium]|nr:hypothetical protein [Clostridia bacterium]
WDNVEKHFNDVIEVLQPILPRHIERWKNMKLENWKKNIHATKYYARVRPKKIPEMLKKAMKLTQTEGDEYFGETLKLLEDQNAARDGYGADYHPSETTQRLLAEKVTEAIRQWTEQ